MFKFVYTFLVVVGWAHVCSGTLRVSQDNFQGQFSFSTMWIPGIELTVRLVARVCSRRAILSTCCLFWVNFVTRVNSGLRWIFWCLINPAPSLSPVFSIHSSFCFFYTDQLMVFMWVLFLDFQLFLFITFMFKCWFFKFFEIPWTIHAHTHARMHAHTS